jgi:hypothetical protein
MFQKQLLLQVDVSGSEQPPESSVADDTSESEEFSPVGSSSASSSRHLDA